MKNKGNSFVKSVESYDMFIIIQDLQGAKECSVLWAQRERLSAFGHTFGVRVDGASPRRFLRFLSLTGPLAPRVADCPLGQYL